MSSQQRHSILGRRLAPVALTAAALAVAVLAPSAAQAASPAKAHRAQATPDQVIDASDPQQQQAAADALNSGCADASKCRWGSDTPITIDYGPPSILGDVLYNCSSDQYAQTAVGVSDQRQESTSMSERVSLTISLSFLKLVSSSASFSVFTQQSEAFSTAVSVIYTVVVPPGYKGWTVTEILSGNVTGSAYITAGIDKLIQVKNIDLSFPGYQDTDGTDGSPVLYTGIKKKMTADDIKASCDTTTVSGASLLRAAQAPSTFKLRLCRRSGRCRSRVVAGSLPPDVRRATARLTRAGRTYGRGTYTRGRTELDLRRPLTAGTYKLVLRERPAASQQIGTAPLRAIKTTVPITVG